MSNVITLGHKIKGLTSAPQFEGFSKVIIIVSDEVEYSAGTDTGRTLTVTNPWGTQAMADNLLQKVRGFRYQPYTATGAHVDPAAELGDGISASDVYSGIYMLDTRFGKRSRSDVSAPSDEEIDHEYPYVPKRERTVNRTLKNLSSELRVHAGLISAEVTERKALGNELRGRLTVQAGQISAKVSSTGGKSGSFGWDLTNTFWELKSEAGTVLKADKTGLEVKGKITALSGTIGGFTIESDYLSYNSHTWDGTNTQGAYLGVMGLQLGKNFKVDMFGNLTATSGKFTGTVYAGNIQYGDTGGTLNGAALTGGSVGGGKITSGSLGTPQFASGVNTSLGFADFANGVFSGWNTPQYLQTINLTATFATFSNMTFQNKDVRWSTITDANGVRHTVLARSDD